MRDKTDGANCAKCCITTKTHLKYLNNLCFSCLVCYGIFKLIYPYLRQTPSDHSRASNHSYLLDENSKLSKVCDESCKNKVLNIKRCNICFEKVKVRSGWHKSPTIVTSHWVVNISFSHELKILKYRKIDRITETWHLNVSPMLNHLIHCEHRSDWAECEINVWRYN